MAFCAFIRKRAGGLARIASVSLQVPVTSTPGVPVVRLALLYACLFFELGVNLPFFPIWLKAQSLDSSAIGIVVAVPLLTRILANPMVGALADRSGRISLVLTACALLVAAGTGLLAVANGLWAILLVVVTIAMAQGPLIALADAMTLGRLAEAERSELIYGRVRLWGSLGFAAANLAAGWSLEWFSANFVIVLLLISAIFTAVAAAGCMAAVPNRSVVVEGENDEAWPAPALLLVGTIAGAALVQASHGAFYGFGTLHWQAAGMSGAAMGGLWALGVLSEVALFAFLGYRMSGAASAAWLLVAAAGTATLRWAGMSQDPGSAALIGLQLLHGVTFGATHLGSIFLLSRLAPGRMQASAQAWLAGGWAGVMALLTTLSGQLYESWGEQIYFVMTAVAATGLVLLVLVAFGLSRMTAGEPPSRRGGSPTMG